jgi:DMSO/TMAO reductase YedYZ molybdopterin-dependent catalytic subunit
MKNVELAGALVGTALFGVAATAMAATPAQAAAADGAADTAQPLVQSVEEQVQNLVKVANVQGTFSFNQDTETSNDAIKAVFQKAKSAICTAVPVYESAMEEFLISVGGAVPTPYAATVAQMAEQTETATTTVSCSCTSNSAGGWAIANSRVSGVSVSDMARLAGL